MTILNSTEPYSLPAPCRSKTQQPHGSIRSANLSFIPFLIHSPHFKQKSELLYSYNCCLNYSRGQTLDKQINPMDFQHSSLFRRNRPSSLGSWLCTSKHYFKQHFSIFRLTWLQRTVINIFFLILELSPCWYRWSLFGQTS